MSRNESNPAPLFRVGADGWCSNVRRAASPNFDERPDGAQVGLLVVHNISLPPREFGGSYIEDFFANRLDHDAHPYFDHLRGVRVSAHFLIQRDGSALQFVSGDKRAWHAGASSFCGRERCNDFSIGIELEGSDFEAFEDAQYETLAALTCALQQHYRFASVAGHEHIAPGRKTDPGPCFDWARYRTLYRARYIAAHHENGPGAHADGAPDALAFPVSV